MENTYKNHTLIYYNTSVGKRKRYHCVKCDLYFSFREGDNNCLYISKYSNLKDCIEQTTIFIDLTCDEVLIKRLLE